MKTAAATQESGVGRAVAVLCLVQFVDVLGVTVVITALPGMLSDLEASASSGALVVTGYAMCFGGLLMFGARLGDRCGHRRVLLAGLSGFAAASLLAATAPSFAVLVTARCLQGAAAALSVPTALRLLLAAAADDQARRRALAGWSAAGAAAGGSGFLLGGAITDLAGWRAVFWINLPLAAVLITATLYSSPRLGPQATGRLDVAGAATLTAAVAAVVAGAALLERPAQRPLAAPILITGVLLLAALAAIERRARAPLLPAAALRDRRLPVAAAASALNTATTGAAATLATLYLQGTRGTSPTATGLLLLPFSLCVIAGSAAAAPLLRRHPPRAGIRAGLVIIAAGTAALLASPSALWLLPAAFATTGLGIGLSSVAANTLGTAVPANLQGVASGLLNTAAQVGTALGVSLFILIATITDSTELPLAGTRLAWGAIAASALAGAVAIGGGRRRVATASTASTSQAPSEP